jgi:hypothetical protein
MRSRMAAGAVAATCFTMLTASAHASTGPYDDPHCPGIQPGASMLPATNQQYATSWNFILRGSDGGTYSLAEGFAFSTMPTASATVSLPQHQERTWPRGNGPGVADGSGAVVAHAVWLDSEAGQSFALVQLDRGRRWSAAVCGYGMPHGIDRGVDLIPTPIPISIYGQGVSVNATEDRAQSDYLEYGRNDAAKLRKVTPTDVGDSGAPVLDGDNQALGLVDSYACCGTNWPDGRGAPAPTGSGNAVYRLAPLMSDAGAQLHITLMLERQPTGIAR